MLVVMRLTIAIDRKFTACGGCLLRAARGGRRMLVVR